MSALSILHHFKCILQVATPYRFHPKFSLELLAIIESFHCNLDEATSEVFNNL